MPTYEYACNTCGHQFEQFQNITDAPVSTCPACHGQVRRLFSAGGGFIMKGRPAPQPRKTAEGCGCGGHGQEKQTCCGRHEHCGASACHD